MWCPITNAPCYSYNKCALKDDRHEKEKCLIAEALKVYIEEHKLQRAYEDDYNPFWS